MGTDHNHQPVLLAEVLEGLRIQPDGVYVDGTFGRGGHAGAILRRLGSKGRLLAMDRDPEAVQSGVRQFGADPRFEIEQGTFTMLSQVVTQRQLKGQVNGMLLDLGVSSPQLDDPQRGFSFSDDGPLDMRMDPGAGISAAQWLARASEQELSKVLLEFGEERYARRVARAVIRARSGVPLHSTRQLAELIAAAVPGREKNRHPATRSFQAIRIFINRELDELQALLDETPDLLARQGRLAVISFHSLEDRIVKRFIRHAYRGDEPTPDLPLPAAEHTSRLRPVGKPIRPGNEELARNPRSRSAVLRIAERLQ